ncbi:hypothetical protein BHE74_00004602 [Ensete ventricosum]|nr:hypothetical protein BHE74_00004602 [Ensete ventricosum]
MELRGVVMGRERLKSGPSILLLDGPEVVPFGMLLLFALFNDQSFNSDEANELVESDDKVSGSCGACSVQRCRAVEFSRMIEGVSDRVSGGFGSVGPGVRGYCSPVGCCVYPDTSLVTRCRGSRGTGRGLAWHVSSVAPSVLRGIVSRPHDCQRMPRGQIERAT